MFTGAPNNSGSVFGEHHNQVDGIFGFYIGASDLWKLTV